MSELTQEQEKNISQLAELGGISKRLGQLAFEIGCNTVDEMMPLVLALATREFNSERAKDIF